MDIAKNMKKLRVEHGLMQMKVAKVVGIYPSSCSKMEKCERALGIEVIDKLGKFFGLAIDEEVKNALYRIIDVKLTKNKFQTFFELNIAAKKSSYAYITTTVYH
jgi:DNA-binding XRE family transcriptional regulator